ncbi:hypothetical protein TPAR_05518, partial [Tolypocladium paradoxum]
MSFYFQPPIFAVRPPGVVVGGWVYPGQGAYVSQPMMAGVYATGYVPIPQTVYLPAPAAAAAAEAAAPASPRLTIRIVFHGHSPAPARALWCR